MACQKVALLFSAELLAEVDLRVIEADLAVLVIGDVLDGVPDAEAGKQQGRAAADAQDHQEEALPVAQHVPQGDLVQEADPPPEPADPLQQDALAVFRGLGPQDGGGHLPQLLAAAVQPHPGGAQQCDGYGQGQHPRLEGIDQLLGEVIQTGISSPEHPGNEPGAEEKAKDAADQAGRAGIDDVFQADKPLVIAHGLPHAHLGALLVHHAGHGGSADQGSHQKEKHREHHGYLLDDGRVLLKGSIAHVLAPGQDIDGGRFDVIQLLLRLGKVGIGLGDLLLGLGKGAVDLVQQLPVIAHVFLRGEAHAVHKVPHLLPGLFLLPGDLRLGIC